MSGTDTVIEADWTTRQREVLDAVLAVLVEDGDRMTMNAVAQRASCSKETLYKWFGDRDGLLTATVKWQAQNVRVTPTDPRQLDRSTLRKRLEEFAANWLSVVSTKTSIALNRVAISEAGSAGGLGKILLENGRFEMGRRLKPILDAGRAKGLLTFDDTETAFRTFFGLVARDVQFRLLLGETLDLTKAIIRVDALRAADQFLALYGAGETSNDSPPLSTPDSPE